MMKMVKIKGKYFISFGPAFSFTTLHKTAYKDSKRDPQLFLGIRKECVWNKVVRNTKAMNAVTNNSQTEEVFNDKIKYEKSLEEKFSI